MHSLNVAAVAIGLLTTPALTQQSAYEQCGGTGYSGSSDCVSVIVRQNLLPQRTHLPKTDPPNRTLLPLPPDYSQCQPGTASTTLATATSTTAAGGSTSTPTTIVTAPTNGSAATGPGTTLQDGYLWIRAVEDPNFHKYLQSAPLYSSGAAVIDVYTQAGQFNVDADGQLVQLVSGAGETPAKLLYAHVAGGATRDGRTLAVTFAAEKGAYGAFAWQGDALTWEAANVTRPNLSAWYVCEGQALFVNLGNYLYETPDGCADETIHYYNDKTAND
ncbi:carbohydrate-binding module family 1 protein [Diplodia corticola]|uniref:Carbohydrate-binding module family 1 protein n=1 Tax=Diplodia corticola TaxID=236234 RepID=A0A1J9QRN8_9PEZI|nr:carbohydrate-binding module family 1 protein [Diplodia corticola]OJD30674.1 carbohydrate-binding module family 1 protein [Diplodia corticola]